MLKVGELILGTVVSKAQAGLTFKVLCTIGVGVTFRCVSDFNVKVGFSMIIFCLELTEFFYRLFVQLQM